MIPQATLDSLDRYVNHKLMPGSFLTAVLSNDLFGAVRRTFMRLFFTLKPGILS